MKNILFALSILILVGSGCANAPAPEAPEVAEGEVAVELALPDYVGTWERQGTYVDGVLEHSYPATLEMQTDSYYSHNDLCETYGSVEATDDTITMAIDMEATDCPIVPGYEVITYTQSFNEDLSEMTIVTVVMGVEVKEIYLRAAEEGGEE